MQPKPAHQAPGRPRRLLLAALTLALVGGACSSPDPKQVLALEDIETYWAIDESGGAETFIAPVVRFQLRNKSAERYRSIEATATFRRAGEPGITWGSDWQRVPQARGSTLKAGERVLVSLKSDGRYHSPGTPESMFQHALFKDAQVEVYLRVGGSQWTKLAVVTVERRIGARSTRVFSAATPQANDPEALPR